MSIAISGERFYHEGHSKCHLLPLDLMLSGKHE